MSFLSRRGLVASLLAATGVTAAQASSTPDKLRVVYHLSDSDKVNFVLGNMQNHIKGVGGPDNIALALVVHGPALGAFKRADENIAVSDPLAALLKSGVGFHACGNTLKGMKLTVADLLDGFVEVPEGGVVRLAALQADGWIYLRP
jgi:uncharacterized protein